MERNPSNYGQIHQDAEVDTSQDYLDSGQYLLCTSRISRDIIDYLEQSPLTADLSLLVPSSIIEYGTGCPATPLHSSSPPDRPIIRKGYSIIEAVSSDILP